MSQLSYPFHTVRVSEAFSTNQTLPTENCAAKADQSVCCLLSTCPTRLRLWSCCSLRIHRYTTVNRIEHKLTPSERQGPSVKTLKFRDPHWTDILDRRSCEHKCYETYCSCRGSWDYWTCEFQTRNTWRQPTFSDCLGFRFKYFL